MDRNYGGEIMNCKEFFIYLFLMAGSTYLIRALPFAAIKKKIHHTFIQSFLYYIPYTVLTAMTIPAVFYVTDHLLSAVFGLATAVFFAWRGKGLTTVAVAACMAVFLAELFM